MEYPDVDVAIIGAGKCYVAFIGPMRRGMLRTIIDIGLVGIAFARFYLDIHPEYRLTILKKDECIGGVWSEGMSC